MSMRTPDSRVCNPFDSDSESENIGPARAFSVPPLSKGNSKLAPFRHTEDGGSGTSSFKPMDFSAAKGRYKTPDCRVSRQQSAYHGFSGSNPFDSDSESENVGPARAFSAPPLSKGTSKVSPFHHTEDGGSEISFKNEFRDSGGFENQPLQQVENFIFTVEETTRTVNNCSKIVEDIREDGARILVKLDQQGEQINQIHLTAASMEHDLSLGEKLLGSLGGLFSKTWKPVRSRQIKGPSIVRDESFVRRGSHNMEQRQRLGLSAPPKVQSNPRRQLSQPTTTLEKIEFEKSKQDDTISYVSDVLDELKEMALDMGAEIDSQYKGLDHLRDDVDTLNDRVKGANRRTRRLLGR